MADLVLPQLGETVTEGTITRWFKHPGDAIVLGEALYEVSTDKVDSEVPSPMEGVIAEIRVPEGDTVDVGTVLAIVEATQPTKPTQSAASQRAETPHSATASSTSSPETARHGQATASEPTDSGLSDRAASPVNAPAVSAPPALGRNASDPSIEGGVSQHPAASTVVASGARLLSPVVRRLVREHGLDPSALVGSGLGGRITRSDVLNAIDELQRAAATSLTSASLGAMSPSATAPGRPSVANPPALASSARSAPANPAKIPRPIAPEWTDGDSRYEAFNNIRRRTGEHMANSVATSPHALTVAEVDYENVEQVRQAHRDQWRAAEGFSLTYLPFIVVAVVDALAHWPRLNASVEDGGLRIWRRRNVGVAVDLDYEGLIVPVLRDADAFSLRGIARTMNDFAARARERRLTPDDISGGTFTISNNGSFGTYTTAAIINQPQVAVLSSDGIARRPVVVTDRFGNESIAIHSVGHLAMGWDHRAFDGSYAAGFLGHVRQMLEGHDWGAEL